MQTQLAPEFKGTADGDAAEAILRKCVHCGFCTATCPTYQLLGDELDGPRGRIYLMKQVLEGAAPTRSTQLHLDRCLTCRNCESTCPSGVQYGQLAEIVRPIVDAKVPRPPLERAQRWALKEGLTSPLFAPAMKLGQALRPLVPASLQNKLPARSTPTSQRWPRRHHERQVLMLAGCVQPAMMPNINAATARVLDAAGIETVVVPGAGCCGAIRTHLNDRAGGLDDMRRNIDAWWPLIEGGKGGNTGEREGGHGGHGGQGGVEAIVMNASGCGAMVKDYGHALKSDPAYAAKAERVSRLTRDLSELLVELLPALAPQVRIPPDQTELAFHPPCTLQHGQQLRGGVEAGLNALGFKVRVAPNEAHLCCGSAGTYSVLQPTLAYQLRDRKLENLAPLEPQVIVSANIGCIQHLQSGTGTPVRHWVEVLDAALAGGPGQAAAAGATSTGRPT